MTVDHRVATKTGGIKLTSKFSRAAMIAGLAIGASGLVAVPAEAANGVSTANYYVNNPAIGSASNITPESASVSASIDTGGSSESLLPVSSSGLLWSPIAGITITPEKWNDGTAPTLTAASTAAYAPVDGLPVSGASSDVSVTITDAAINNSGVTDPGIGVKSGVPQALSNAGNDSYSDVTFEYDSVADYVANGDLPGPATQQIQDVQVPTTGGLSSLSATIGAFGQAAQNATGNTPLTPGTKYYYWVVQQAGATDQASNINVSAWVNNQSNGAPANNSYKCLPNIAIAADPTLNSYTQPNATVNWGGVSLPADQGPCIYYFGNTGGALYYQSPNGEFTTPAIGSVKIGASAKLTTVTTTRTVKIGKKKHKTIKTVKPVSAWLTVTDSSNFKASGTVELTSGGKLAGTAKFSLQPHAKALVKIALTSKGKTAMLAKQTVKVAPVSTTVTVASASNWDQPFSGKSVKL
jgi:hypothetical protein